MFKFGYYHRLLPVTTKGAATFVEVRPAGHIGDGDACGYGVEEDGCAAAVQLRGPDTVEGVVAYVLCVCGLWDEGADGGVGSLMVHEILTPP